MIAKLRGLIDGIGEDWAVVDVGGVGYLVYCSSRTLSTLPGAGEEVVLAIDTHVREDHIHLYGFLGVRERDWFRLLQTVQGVGARVALAILSVLPPDELNAALAAQDKKAIGRANGVGPKLAARIVNELKDKAAALAISRPAAPLQAVPTAGGRDAELDDAVSALANLGYGAAEAYSAVAAARRELGEGAELQALIKGGLKELAP